MEVFMSSLHKFILITLSGIIFSELFILIFSRIKRIYYSFIDLSLFGK